MLCYSAGWRAVLGDVCTVKAVLADFGEAPRREFKREGIHVLTLSTPGGGGYDEMKLNRAGSAWLYSRTGLRRWRRHRRRQRNRGI